MSSEGVVLLDQIISPDGLSKTFDTKTALSGLYLWLLFGYLSTMVSCDIQRWMHHSLFFRHFVGIIAFFFLFTVLDTSNKSHIIILWLKTFFIYGVFLLMVKSKWYFSLPVLLMLLVDQSIKVHRDYLNAHNSDEDTLKLWDKIRNYINLTIIGLIVVGFGHYTVRQYLEFGSKFDFSKLLFSYGCKTV
jgi:hypothetical protein